MRTIESPAREEGKGGKVKTKIKPGHGWAWALDWNKNGDWTLCHWVEPDRKRLVARSKPSPEARPVHVAIVPMCDWRKPAPHPARRVK